MVLLPRLPATDLVLRESNMHDAVADLLEQISTSSRASRAPTYTTGIMIPTTIPENEDRCRSSKGSASCLRH